MPCEGRSPVEEIISKNTIPLHSQTRWDSEEQGKLPLPNGQIGPPSPLYPSDTGEASKLLLTQVPRAGLFFFFSPSHFLLVLFNFLQAFLSGSVISLYPSEPWR